MQDSWDNAKDWVSGATDKIREDDRINREKLERKIERERKDMKERFNEFGDEVKDRFEDTKEYLKEKANKARARYE